jgi:hypothetical protein
MIRTFGNERNLSSLCESLRGDLAFKDSMVMPKQSPESPEQGL